LYRHETWPLTLRDEHRLTVFENGLLKIFGPKREEIIGGWRKLHLEDLCNLYFSPNIIRMIKSKRMRWQGNATHMGGITAHKIIVAKLEGKRPLGRPRHRWQDNIKVVLGKRCDDVNFMWLRIGTGGRLLWT
jgi:hypothetical protein